jgi:hypothetical protein
MRMEMSSRKRSCQSGRTSASFGYRDRGEVNKKTALNIALESLERNSIGG